MESLVLVVHVILSAGVIGLVLMQQGKGADAGASFGGGASSTVFGAKGSGSFMTRLTTIFASLFFVTSVLLFFIAAHRDGGTNSVTEGVEISQPVKDAPVVETTSSDSDVPVVPTD